MGSYLMRPANRWYGKVAFYFVVLLITFFFLFPIVWELFSSFKTAEDIRSVQLFTKPTLNNWKWVIEHGFLQKFKNTAIVVLSSTFITVLCSSLAAYSITSEHFKGRRIIAYFILMFQMLPLVCFTIPLFSIMHQLKMINTYISLILTYSTFFFPLATWLLIGYFGTIEKAMKEAAIVDGCSWYGIFWRIVLPLSKTGIVAVIILVVIWGWSEFLFALVLSGRDTQTINVAATGVMTPYLVNFGGLAAVSIFAVLPVIIFSIFVQKQLVRGLSFGAIKG